MAASQVTASMFPPEKRWAYLTRAKTIRVATTNAAAGPACACPKT
jgi:hypothetical protein